MTTPRSRRTHGLRVLPGGNELAVRLSLDYEQTLFRRNYRRPVLVAAAATAEAEDVARWAGAGAFELLGADVAARALNRIAAEGAEPLMLQAIVRGGRGDDARRTTDGIAEACLAADCAFIDELSPAQTGQGGGESLTVMAAATGVVEKSRMMDVRRFEPGDVVLAIGSDRLWPDTLGPVRERLRTADPDKPLGDLAYTAADALVRPAPVLAGSLQQVLRQYHVKRVVHAMTPVEADGLAAALERLTAGRCEVRRTKPRRSYSPLMAALDLPESVEAADEGHLTGIGFLMVASSPFAAVIARRLRHAGHSVYQFGRLAEATSRS